MLLVAQVFLQYTYLHLVVNSKQIYFKQIGEKNMSGLSSCNCLVLWFFFYIIVRRMMGVLIIATAV